jgi:hypothetical protein
LSSISLSLASVLVISANSRMFSPKHLAERLRRRRLPRRRVAVGQQVQRLGDGQLLAADLEAQPAMVSSNSRFQAARPATYFSCSSFSISSEAGAGGTRAGRAARARSAPAPEPRASLQRRVVEPVDLQREEQQVGGDRRSPAPASVW